MILDGNAIIHRAFHAIPPLVLEDGTQINAVYGFTSTLLSVLEKFQPDYIIATFDEPGKNFRHDMFPDYKANRKKTPEELGPQFALTQEVVKAININIKKLAKVEADDVIGSLSVSATKAGLDTIIVTGDKDTLQLVNDNVSVFTMSRGIQDMLLFDRKLVIEKMGITPKQVIEYKGLRGDTSDNIPGVKGIGDKGAVNLLSRFKTLEGIYENIDDKFIKKGIRKKLIDEKEKAFLSRELGIIKTDLNIDLDIEKSKTSNISMDGARKIFSKFGFKSLLKRLPESEKKEEETLVNTILKKDDVSDIIKELENNEVSVALDVYDSTLQGVCLSLENKTFYFPFKEMSNEIKKVLNNKCINFFSYDVKKMMHLCDDIGIEQINFFTDVLLEAYVLNTGKKLDFEKLVFDVLEKDLLIAKKDAQLTLNLRDVNTEIKNVSQRANYIYKLHKQFTKDIEKTIKSQNKNANIKTLLNKIEIPTLKVLYNMEKAGMSFDKEIFKKQSKQINEMLLKLTSDIHKLAKKEFNINSTKQLKVVLFDELNLPTKGIKKTKTGYSTAASELEKLKDKHVIIEKIELYRELFKLKTTYVDSLPDLVSDDGRIHSTFNQVVTSTGRLSSSNPNLQNIPVKTELGKALREGFVAKDDNILIGIDYSQIDLRCVAHISNDTEMIKAFNNSVDIHTFTSASVLGKKISDVTKQERSSAKELNFGLIYGMGIRNFAKSANLSTDRARKFVDEYFKKFSGIKKFIDDTKKSAYELGYVETIFGRRKYTPELRSKNSMLKAMGERAAVNMPVQGLAADIMKLAMIEVDNYLQREFEKNSVKIILQIHDEIILEAPKNVAQKVSKNVKQIMEKVCKLKVPLVVDVAMGSHWGEL